MALTGDTLDFVQGGVVTSSAQIVDGGATVGDVLTVQADKSIAAAPGGGSQPAILMSSTTIDAADLLALDTTAIELLPAPGGRFYHVFQGIVLHYRFGTTPFSGDLNPGLGYGTDPAAMDADYLIVGGLTGGSFGVFLDLNDVVAQSEDVYYIPAPLSGVAGGTSAVAWPATVIEDAPVSIANYPGSPLVDGDGSVTVRLFYSLINGAPA